MNAEQVKQFEAAAHRLQHFAEVVYLKTRGLVQEVSDALFENTPLPEHCPSKKALALLILRDVGDKLEELDASYQELDRMIRSEGSTDRGDRDRSG